MIYSRALNPALLSILCHPRTHEPLQIADGHLVAPQSSETFLIRQGIPRLTVNQTPFRHRFWGWVYNQMAFAYDWGVGVAWQWKLGGQPIQRESYLNKIRLQPGELVLETAIGTGTNVEHLPADVRYVVLDISFQMLRRCAKKLKNQARNVQLVQGDAQLLPFFDGTFDAVYHMGGLQFLAQPQAALAEALRVTKPGGKLWMVDEAYAIPALLRSATTRTTIDVSSPRQGIAYLPMLLPATAEDVQAELISNDELYILSFSKCKT